MRLKKIWSIIPAILAVSSTACSHTRLDEHKLLTSIVPTVAFPLAAQDCPDAFRGSGIELELTPLTQEHPDSSGSFDWVGRNCWIQLTPIRVPGESRESIVAAEFACRHNKRSEAEIELQRWIASLGALTKSGWHPDGSFGPITTDSGDGRQRRVKGEVFRGDTRWISRVVLSDPKLAVSD